jgi:methanogenic corrinoid protein MtbC1
MLVLDERQMSSLLDRAIHRLGFEQAMMGVVYPFLQRIGLMWQIGSVSPAQEHFVTHVLRQKMMASTDALSAVPTTAARRWVLFLPSGELHELALLFMNYLLRARGHHVLYLGQNLPIVDLKNICQVYQPHVVCTVLTAAPERDRLQEFVDELRRLCGGTKLLLYGSLVQNETLVLPANTIRLCLMTDFLALADEFRLPTMESAAEPA